MNFGTVDHHWRSISGEIGLFGGHYVKRDLLKSTFWEYAFIFEQILRTIRLNRKFLLKILIESEIELHKWNELTRQAGRQTDNQRPHTTYSATFSSNVHFLNAVD